LFKNNNLCRFIKIDSNVHKEKNPKYYQQLLIKFLTVYKKMKKSRFCTCFGK